MIKPITVILTYILLSNLVSSSFAQNSDKKVFISNKEETYTYELNNKGEVQVKVEYVIKYKCLKPSTVSFVEFYDNDSEIKNVRIKGIKEVSPQYGMYNQGNIFFSDSKACYFDLPFTQSDSEATVILSKLYRDVRRFVFLPLAEPYYTNSRTIIIVIPDWMEVDILNQNLFENIKISSIVDESKKSTVHTIHISNQDEYVPEENSPHYMHSLPYILVIPRGASIKSGDISYFKTTDNLYQWSKEPLLLMDNNSALITKKASELTANCLSDQDKINKLCKWVQQNIRYIAFMDGISAFKPDNAQDVIANKYGDCKGMSNLLKSLLLSEGFDARLAWVATADIERDLDKTNPIPFANHMICALYKKDSLYYFDPTVKSLIFGEIPEQLQGQTALIEDGENYIISQIPQNCSCYNRDSLFAKYSIIDNRLMGKIDRHFKGESRHSISYWMNNMTETEMRHTTEEYLRNGEVRDSIFNIETKGLKAFLPEICIQYEINKKSNMNIFGNEVYINLDDTKDYQNTKIDMEKRKSAFKRPYKDYTVRVAEFTIPDGYKIIQLPPNVKIDREKYSFVISYTKDGDSIIYCKKISIYDPVLEKADFEQWNTDIDSLRKAYGELIGLKKIN